MCEVLLNLAAPVKVLWRTDLFGGNGSRCPMLLANDSLTAYRAAIFNNVLPNREGVLVLWVVLQYSPGRHALPLQAMSLSKGRTSTSSTICKMLEPY